MEPGSSLVLDDSTTGLAMLPYLAQIPELTIVTTFVSIVDEVAQMTDRALNVIGIGGAYDPKYHAFGGEFTGIEPAGRPVLRRLPRRRQARRIPS